MPNCGLGCGSGFLDKTALNATLHGRDVSSERDSARQPRHGCHASRVRSCVRSELLSVTVKTIQQRQAPLSGSPAKSCSLITFYFYVLWLEHPHALSSAISSHCIQRRHGRDFLEHAH